MRESREEQTSHWQTGDVVTMATHSGEVRHGIVRRTRPRHRDGKTFVRVRITDGPAAGHEDWDTGLWELGIGVLRRACLDCGFPFYTSDSDQSFCPICQRGQRPDESPGRMPVRGARLGHLDRHRNDTGD